MSCSALIDVDGRNVFNRVKGSCSFPWQTYNGVFPNPWNGDVTADKCFTNVDIVVPHTSWNMTLEVYSSVTQGLADESFLFDDIRIILR